MIERALVDIYTQGRNAILATPTLLDGIFQPEGQIYRVSNAELVKIKAFFAQAQPPVRHGYGDQGMTLPCWIVTPKDETLDQPLLGHMACDDEELNEEVIGGVERRTYSVISMAKANPAQAYYMHKVAKAILLRNLVVLQTVGAGNITWGGEPIEPVADLFPDVAVFRTLDITCHVEEYVNLALPLATITRIDLRRDDVGGEVHTYEVVP